jgi:hypothetical protein
MEGVNVAICAVIKDEHQYLSEWIEYHLALGIDAIYLYEDEGSESHYDICSKYDNVFLTGLADFIGEIHTHTNKQLRLYNKFLLDFRSIVDYVFFIDLDEFVAFEEGFTLEDLVKKCSISGALLIPWKIYSANGLINKTGENVVDTFVVSIENPRKGDLDYKTFAKVSCQEDKSYMKHHHEHALARPLYASEKRKCHLKHYITKSWEEWCERILRRGQIVRNYRKLDDFFLYNKDMEGIREELYKYCEKHFENGGEQDDKR